METTDIIREKLSQIGEEYAGQKSFMQEYLIKIEEIIQEKEMKKNDAILFLKANSFTVSSIAKEVNCSRTTLYNHNQLLKRYIELSMQQYFADNPFSVIEENKKAVAKLKQQIDLMEVRDIMIEELKNENRELKKLLSEKGKHQIRAEKTTISASDNSQSQSQPIHLIR